MKEQVADLSLLEKKFQDEIKALEDQLLKTKKRLTIVTEAIELLKEGGTFNQDNLFIMPETLSDKYKGVPMRKAIEEILRSYHGKKVSAGDVLSNLKKNGFVSKSKNLKRDVYTRLFRLRKSGILCSRTEGGLKKYFIKEDKIEEEAKNEKGGMS
jgi:cell division protein FtsB